MSVLQYPRRPGPDGITRINYTVNSNFPSRKPRPRSWRGNNTLKRDTKDTMQHAALINIVAAVNEDIHCRSVPRKGSGSTSNSLRSTVTVISNLMIPHEKSVSIPRSKQQLFNMPDEIVQRKPVYYKHSDDLEVRVQHHIRLLDENESHNLKVKKNFVVQKPKPTVREIIQALPKKPQIKNINLVISQQNKKPADKQNNTPKGHESRATSSVRKLGTVKKTEQRQPHELSKCDAVDFLEAQSNVEAGMSILDDSSKAIPSYQRTKIPYIRTKSLPAIFATKTSNRVSPSLPGHQRQSTIFRDRPLSQSVRKQASESMYERINNLPSGFGFKELTINNGINQAPDISGRLVHDSEKHPNVRILQNGNWKNKVYKNIRCTSPASSRGSSGVFITLQNEFPVHHLRNSRMKAYGSKSALHDAVRSAMSGRTAKSEPDTSIHTHRPVSSARSKKSCLTSRSGLSDYFSETRTPKKVQFISSESSAHSSEANSEIEGPRSKAPVRGGSGIMHTQTSTPTLRAFSPGIQPMSVRELLRLEQKILPANISQPDVLTSYYNANSLINVQTFSRDNSAMSKSKVCVNSDDDHNNIEPLDCTDDGQSLNGHIDIENLENEIKKEIAKENDFMSDNVDDNDDKDPDDSDNMGYFKLIKAVDKQPYERFEHKKIRRSSVSSKSKDLEKEQHKAQYVKIMSTCQVRVLTLNKGENHQTTLFRLEKGWQLRFVLGPSLHASTVRLFCNHPSNKDVPFERSTYFELQWKSSSGSKSDSHDVYTEISMVTAGSFNYFFTIDNSEDIENANGQGYFLVDPTLSVGDKGKQFTLDCLQCQSVISKSLGPFDEWEGRLYVSKATGYNLVHLTPIQALGTSNSAYSIKDQLQLNPVYNRVGQNFDFSNVEGLIKKMNREWEVLSLTDLVYNHSADNSPWLEEHPECGYNMQNSPHLKPAYLLDRVLAHFSLEVAEGKWKSQGIPPVIDEEAIIQKIREVLLYEVLPGFKMLEFFTVNIDDIMKRFKHGIEENRVIDIVGKELEIIQDPQFLRNGCRIDMDVALKLYNIDRPGVTSREQRIKACCDSLRNDLEALNNEKLTALHDDLDAAVSNFMANIRWRFLDPHGPEVEQVTEKQPLMHNYFIVARKYTGSVNTEEAFMNGEEGKYIFACNGWVMGDDPLRNFAEPGSKNIYLRRELVGWGDSAKLNYGKKPEDRPYLWQRMKEYTEITARIFHGVRLDNCHSTPIHVAEYMLDAARKIRPDLYVIAELFTGGENLDNLFINKLGINSLIREAMSPTNSHDLGGLIHRYGGQPVGAFIQPRMKPLVKTMAHAMLFDQTHDNDTPIKKKSAYDMLPTAALVSMACCATGSNRGYDQMVPHHIHVVTEERKYPSWADWDFPERQFINQTFGISQAKTLLNKLHFMMGNGGVTNDERKEKHNFSQVYVDQVDEHTVSVTRHNPVTHESIVLVARTAFSKPKEPENTPYIRPLTIQGVVENVLFEIQTLHTDAYEYTRDEDFINGLPDYYLKLQENIPPSLSKMAKVEATDDGTCSIIHLKTFTPGSIIAFRSVLPQPAQHAILEIRRGLGQFGYLMRSYSGRKLFDESVDTSNFRSIVSALSLADLNIALFRCAAEEEADGNGFGVYNIPGFGNMNFCGLRGITTVLGMIRAQNDLGHALCKNLRGGDWLPSYIANRLLVHPGTVHLGHWFTSIFKHLSIVPRYLIPSYFDAIITGAYVILRQHAFSSMSDFVADGSTFIQALAMGSVMFCGYVKNSRLPFLSPNLENPKPPTVQVETKAGVTEEEACLSIAAGFPHFASSYMRNWGRDTFIALRGLLLLTGRYQEARYIILAYAGCLRHGLIPNLLNEGTGARFNCRDATWWWLQSIQEYCKQAPDGYSILKDKVSRLYPEDDTEAQEAGLHEQLLCDVMQEAIQIHATGPAFRETNAGTKIDSVMTSKGFNVEIGVNWETGFVYGGNEHNCGTWMDKMGSSEKGGNKGKPATPRDGSAVELIGLSASCILWLHDLFEKGLYNYEGVNVVKHGQKELITFKDWHELLCANFEQFFWVNTEAEETEEAPELIFRRGMYKDTYNATQFWTNTQLRPNYPVSMVVAPELFSPDKAWIALQTAQENLLGPLGMKTLDPNDWSYVPYYDNSNDSEDGKVSKGFSYHQGPEWVWPIGYFLRAKLIFAKKLESSRPGILHETVLFIRTTLTRHYEEVMKSSWRSLPEVTNHDGEPNHFGCPAQAWSVSCVLDVLYDLEKLDTDTTLQPSKSTEDLVVAPV